MKWMTWKALIPPAALPLLVSVAVALDDGLITPIIRRADQKGLAEISAEMQVAARTFGANPEIANGEKARTRAPRARRKRH